MVLILGGESGNVDIILGFEPTNDDGLFKLIPLKNSTMKT